MPSVAHLLRPDIAALEPYTPVVPPDVQAARLGLPIERIIKLDANENPYGPAPRVAEALARAGAGAPNPYAIYPDPDQAQLREALSHYTGQPVERIICGAGSDEIIDLLMRAFLQPGEAIIDCPPTFGMYTFDAGLVAARVANVPRDESFELDLEGIAEAAEQGAKLLFVAAPNNPTGNPLPRQAVERLLELSLLVVIDEAYAEFAGASVAGMVGSYPNLVVLRTFSKWAGLAGLRIGYGLIHEELIAHLWKIKQPYNINAAAQIAALASLEDREYLRGNVARIVAERERLYAALQALPGLHVYPSQANFLLCRLMTTDQGPPTTDSRDTVTRRQGDMVTELGETVTPSPLHPFTPSEQSVVGGQSSVVGGQSSRAAALKETLMRRGILVRYYNKPGLRDCIRISIGTPEQNDAALAALAEALTTSV